MRIYVLRDRTGCRAPSVGSTGVCRFVSDGGAVVLSGWRGVEARRARARPAGVPLGGTTVTNWPPAVACRCKAGWIPARSTISWIASQSVCQDLDRVAEPRSGFFASFSRNGHDERAGKCPRFSTPSVKVQRRDCCHRDMSSTIQNMVAYHSTR